MNANQEVLSDMTFWAREKRETRSQEIAGHLFEVSVHIVNRKCYDFMPTPTVSVKMDGKRIGYSKAMAAIA